jgi:peptidoglycan hydrolase-like protein with peptidoglycan-binding domain
MGNVLGPRPRGVIQNEADQGTQYQIFPEDYFAAADVTLYFGDTWIDDCMALQFSLSEKVIPLYSYGSYTADAFARGNRIVQGSFGIAFREAGYLSTVLDQLAHDSYLRPPIADVFQGKNPEDSKFTGRAKQRIEDILQGFVPDARASSEDDPLGLRSPAAVKLWPILKYGMGKKVFIESPMNDPQGLDDVPRYIKTTKMIMTRHGYFTGTIDGFYDEDLVRCIREFQKVMGIYPITGFVDAETRTTIVYAEAMPEKARYASWKESQRNALVGAKTAMAKYEAEVWGRGELLTDQETYPGARNDIAKKYQPYFYGSKAQNSLRARGFDIFITYGPIAEDIEITSGKLGFANREAGLGFNTTVKAIRNVQLAGTQQSVSAANGEPIIEMYTFMAEDID